MIALHHVCFRYPDQPADAPWVLEDINLEIAQGSFVAVLGHNGSGKSTLAKLMNALLRPTQGEVYAAGYPTHREEELLTIRRNVGMVFQNPDNQIVASVVEEDVAFGPENLGLPPEEIRRRVDESLQAVGMWDYRAHAPHLLSGGQKQRVAIAGVLAMSPRCLILDESTAMLDPVGRREILDTVHRLHREQNMTVVLITHHMEEAAQAERVVIMDGGRVLRDGPPAAVFQDGDALQRAGLTPPETVRLLAALRRAGYGLPQDALSVEDCAQAIYALLRGQ